MKNLYLPKDTFEAKANSIDNFALRMNKYPPAYVNIKKNVTEFALHHFDKKQKIRCELSLNLQDSTKQILKFSAKYLHNLSKIPNIKLETSYLKPDWKLIVGLGSPSVYETSITLHHIYGFPYIPGQAVKGVTRNYVICKYFYKDEKRAEEDEIFKKIFGTQTQAGEIIFFDAYPQTEPKMDFDIMNVHYPDYYSGKSEPTDDQNPNPITFLTVKDTTFFFPIGIPKIRSNEDFFVKGKSISDLVKFALEEKGLGAKTSVGYGYLLQSDRPFKEYDALIKKEKEEREKNKPLFQKIIDSLTYQIEEALNFICDINNDTQEKEEVKNKLKELFQNKTVWKRKKEEDHHFEFSNQADKFLDLTKDSDDQIIQHIKEYGGKKLKNKYSEHPAEKQVKIKPPSNIKEVDKVMIMLNENPISKDEFIKIKETILKLFKKDEKKNKLKRNKKDRIKKELLKIEKVMNNEVT